MITENLSTLKIHKLTQAQYDRELEAGRVDENALYLTPEEDFDLSDYATKESVEAQLNNKQNKIIGAAGQVVGFDADGNTLAQNMPNEIVVSNIAPTDENAKIWINPSEDDYSGSSTVPDLVIGLNVANTKTGTGEYPPALTYEDVSIESGSVSAVAEKIKQGLPVKVLLKEIHFYNDRTWSRGIAEAVHTSLCFLEEYPSDNPYGVAFGFYLAGWPSYSPFPIFVFIMLGFNPGEVMYQCRTFVMENE